MLFRFAIILAAFAFGVPTAAEAAPQILGLIASNGHATPLDCDGGDCTAQLSAFCLQETRHPPSSATRYEVAPGGDIALLVTTADGRGLRLPVAGSVEFETLIGFTSVKATLPETEAARLVAELGATGIAIEIGPLVSLLPADETKDPNPQSEDEIALATGAMRDAAQAMFEARGVGDGARITNLLINALPAWQDDQMAAARHFWDRPPPLVAVAAPEGLKTAERIYRGCRISVESRSALSMKSCLQLKHADMMAETNHRFWRESGGS